VLSCGSPAAYLTTRPAVAALPVPVIEVRDVPLRGPATPATGIVSVKGVVVRIYPGPRPAYGFTLELLREDRSRVVLDIRLFHPAQPDLKPGTAVSLTLVREESLDLRIAGDSGPILVLYSGPAGLSDRLPVDVRSGPGHAYTEVVSRPDLCRLTVVHSPLVARVQNRDYPLNPGEDRRIDTDRETYRVVAVDSRFVEESDCGAAEDPKVSFFWMRIPKESP
jgi:hypothetical protein